MAPIAGGRKLPQTRAALWFYFLPFAFDFRGEAGGSVIQVLFTIICFLAFSFLMAKGEGKFAKTGRFPGALYALYILGTFVTFFLSGFWSSEPTPFGNYIKTLAPYLLCGMSFCIVCSIAARGIDPTIVIKPLLWSTLISQAFRTLYAILAMGVKLEDARYQIISGALPFLVAYGFTSLWVSSALKPTAILSLLASLAVTVLSSTRSYLITVAAVILSLVFLSPIRLSNMTQKAKAFTVILGVMGAMAGLVLFIRPDALVQWQNRFLFQQKNHAQFDLTYATRMAEYSGQLKLLKESPTSLMLGRGVGSSYYWDGDSIYGQFLKSLSLFDSSVRWEGGHSFWFYTLYSTGLLCSLPLALFLWQMLARSFALARASLTCARRQDSLIYLLPFVTIISYFGQSFTSSPYGDRFSGLVLGTAFGLGCVLFSKSKATRQ